MEAETIKKLAAEAVLDSIAHGYEDHRKERSRVCVKAICEVAEAVEAFRDNNFAKIRGFIRANKINDGQPDHPSHDDRFMVNYRTRMKDSVQDEMTDVVIYLFILLSTYGYDISKVTKKEMVYNSFIPDDFITAAGLVMSRILSITSSENPVREILIVINIIERWMYNETGDDLEWMIGYKMKFNKLRPYRHGRKEDPTI